MSEATTKGMVIASGGERFPLWFQEGMAQATSGSLGWIGGASAASPALTSASSDADVLKVMSNLGKSDTMSTYKTGHLATLYLGYLAGGGSGGAFSEATVLNGLNALMAGIIGGKSMDEAVAELTGYGSVGAFRSAVAGGSAPGLAGFVKNYLGAVEAGGPNALGGLITGSVAAADFAPDSIPTNSGLFKLYPNNVTVKNTYPDYMTVVSGGSVTQGGTSPSTPFDPSVTPPGPGPGGGSFNISLQIGPTAAEVLELSFSEISAASLGIQTLDATSAEAARSGLDTVREAINKVSAERGQIGAWQRRLEHTRANLDVMHENLVDAESRIRDKDMALGMMDFTRQQVLLQASQAMLAQANQLPNQVLALLRA